ncbi:hypothetical protein BSKO_12480 [Bryopsis sp. KO-2023]|nr:hypothetical protein BSKO_12480 [Bryopsis sp. KO-2023]
MTIWLEVDPVASFGSVNQLTRCKPLDVGAVNASFVAITALVLLMSAGAQEKEVCESGPAPPADFGAFIWVRSGFEPSGGENEQSARTRLRADFLCQKTIDNLQTTSSTTVPIRGVDFSEACRVPQGASCNLLSSCPSVSFPRVAVPELADGEILVEPPRIELPDHQNVLLGICFEESCSILGVENLEGMIFGALAYRLCPNKYVNSTANGWTALHWVAAMEAPLHRFVPALESSVELSVRSLVENGASLEARDDQGFTPLHLASKFGFTTPLQSFVDAGADLEALDNRGNTPLAIASYFGQDLASEVLLEAGANPNVKYVDDVDQDSALVTNSRAPLHFAALYARRTRMVEALIEAGADVDVVDGAGNTPLRIAEQYGRVKVLKLLRENGAGQGG